MGYGAVRLACVSFFPDQIHVFFKWLDVVECDYCYQLLSNKTGGGVRTCTLQCIMHAVSWHIIRAGMGELYAVKSLHTHNGVCVWRTHPVHVATGLAGIQVRGLGREGRFC